MPYISSPRRHSITSQNIIDTLSIENSGDLNYAITYLIHRYYTQGTMNYRAINDILGALEGAKLEFYRRVAVPYEDKKIEENGDVY